MMMKCYIKNDDKHKDDHIDYDLFHKTEGLFTDNFISLFYRSKMTDVSRYIRTKCVNCDSQTDIISTHTDHKKYFIVILFLLMML